MPEDIEVRELRESDLEGVYQVAAQAWQYTYAGIFSPDFIKSFVDRNYAPEASRQLLPRLQAEEHCFYVALAQSTVVGFCHFAETTRSMELFRIYLQPAWIGQGIGRELLRLGEEFVRRRGYRRYTCFVHKDNEIGKGFYLKNGFIHLAEHDKEDEWFMEKRLA